MTSKQSKSKAFTLIELLVVIAIIGLLSSIVLASLSGARESAQVTRMASDLKQIETAMTMWVQNTDGAQWPDDNNYTNDSGGLVPLGTLMSESSFSEYINTSPEPPVGDGYYAYDYDESQGPFDCEDPDSDSINYGVNLYVTDTSQEIQEKVDDIIDGDDDLGCGKVTGGGTNLIYKISDDQSF